MDFILGLLRNQSGCNFIWVIVDRLTKVAHFIPVKMTNSGLQLAELYMSDRGTQFTLKLWERLHETLDTQLSFSSAYHPHTDG
jgi:hypothetical protein